MNRILKLMPSLIALLAFCVLADQASSQSRRGRKPDVFEFLAKKYDANNDGKLSKEEYNRSDENFKRFDTNKDGFLTAADWSAGDSTRQRRGGRRNGGGSSAPAVGDEAPDFALTYINDEEEQVKLSSFAGEKPVALIFGSCT